MKDDEIKSIFSFGLATNAHIFDHFIYPDYTDRDAFRKQAIWRYCSIEQLTDLVSSSSLYMPRGDQFDDRYEGLIYWIDEEKLSNESTADQAWKFTKSKYRDDYFISCWHINDTENPAWWERYGLGKRLVIKSTIGSLISSIEAREQSDIFHLIAAQVRYTNSINRRAGIGSSMQGGFEPFAFKDRAFEHEKEFRLIGRISPERRDQFAQGRPHVRLQIDPEILIDSIVLSPFCKKEEAEFIRGGLARLNTKVDVLDSGLDRAESAEELDFEAWTDKFFSEVMASRSQQTEDNSDS